MEPYLEIADSLYHFIFRQFVADTLNPITSLNERSQTLSQIGLKKVEIVNFQTYRESQFILVGFTYLFADTDGNFTARAIPILLEYNKEKLLKNYYKINHPQNPYLLDAYNHFYIQDTQTFYFGVQREPTEKSENYHVAAIYKPKQKQLICEQILPLTLPNHNIEQAYFYNLSDGYFLENPLSEALWYHFTFYPFFINLAKPQELIYNKEYQDVKPKLDIPQKTVDIKVSFEQAKFTSDGNITYLLKEEDKVIYQILSSENEEKIAEKVFDRDFFFYNDGNFLYTLKVIEDKNLLLDVYQVK